MIAHLLHSFAAGKDARRFRPNDYRAVAPVSQHEGDAAGMLAAAFGTERLHGKE